MGLLVNTWELLGHMFQVVGGDSKWGKLSCPISLQWPIGSYNKWRSFFFTWFYQYKHIFWRSGKEVFKKRNRICLSPIHLQMGLLGKEVLKKNRKKKKTSIKYEESWILDFFFLAPPSLFIYDLWLIHSTSLWLPFG